MNEEELQKYMNEEVLRKYEMFVVGIEEELYSQGCLSPDIVAIAYTLLKRHMDRAQELNDLNKRARDLMKQIDEL